MDRVYKSLHPGDWALAISESTKADLCEYRGIDPARVFVTHLAADPELFNPCVDAGTVATIRERYGIPESAYILSVNTFEPRKNIDHAIRAFAQLVQQEHMPGLNLVLVGGEGWKYEGVLDAIQEAEAVRERIIVAGYVRNEDLAALYSGALAFVYPSFYEGFGLPVLEAMQCGAPVIASNTSSLPEVVGNAGILLDPRDVNGMAHAMFELYRSSCLRDALRTKGLVQAKKFSWERCTRETLTAYRMALGFNME